NLDSAVSDLADLHFEEAAYKIRVTAADDNLRPACTCCNSDDVGADTIADIVIFGLHALLVWHYRLNRPEIDDDVGTNKSLYRAAHNFADTILEFVVCAHVRTIPSVKAD